MRENQRLLRAACHIVFWSTFALPIAVPTRFAKPGPLLSLRRSLHAEPSLTLRGGGGGGDNPIEGFSDLDVSENAEAQKENFNIVMVGHVDAGKSTISGQLLYCTGMLDSRTLEKYEREATNLGRESWKFAWAMDVTDAERAKGKTHELGTAEFETKTRSYTILDAPGHKSFVPSMLTGAAQAEAAVVVISARKGEFEAGFEKGGQTREHTILVKTMGVQYLLVAVNKMDEVEWSEERFQEIKDKFGLFAKSVGFNVQKNVLFLPISGLHCINMKEPLDPKVCKWFQGPCLMDALDSIKVEQSGKTLPLRMPVTERYKDGETFVMGKVECGKISNGDSLMLMPRDLPLSVTQVLVNSREVETAAAGDMVRLRVKCDDEQVHIGDVVTCAPAPHKGCARFEAKVNLLECKSIVTTGYECMLHVHALQVECSFGKIKEVQEKGKKGKPKMAPRFLRQGQTATLDILLSSPVWLDTFKEVPHLGRFVLRDEGVTVAVGVITQLFEE